MTREEAIEFLRSPIKCSDKGDERDLREAMDMAIKSLEQEPCENEYIKVPKKALKYRTAGMIAYNAEWLKNHFDIERAVICGEQEKGGRWIRELIRNEHGGCIGARMICSKCGQDNGYDKRMKFCPNCGKKMEVDNEEA